MEYNLLYSPEKVASLSFSEKENESSTQKWEPGQIIDDKYQIESVLAKDEDEVIHKVKHLQWNIHLAVRSLLQKETQVSFFHEAERWVALEKHPNIVAAYYVQNIGGVPRLFVEYVEGKTLKDIAQQEYDIETILDIAIQMCWGMNHVHKHGLLHGDLRPGNVFITKDYEIKITDFRSRGEMVPQYSPYMPPEQFDKDIPLQPAIDIYAFGVLLYELCLKELPFKVDKELKEEAAIERYTSMALTQSLIPPHNVNAEVPETLSNVIMACLSANPSERPRDFEDISELLIPIYPQLTGFRYPRKAPNTSRLIAVDLNNRALSLLDLHQQEQAEEYLENAVEADPNCIGARINLHLLKLRNGRTSLASLLAETEPLISMDREVVAFYRSRICLEYGGFLDEALKEASQALEEFPDNKELQRVKAGLLQRLGDYEQAMPIYLSLLETESPSVRDFYNLGSCYLNINKSKSAKEIWEKGALAHPGNSYLNIGLGVATAMRGQVESAHMHFSNMVSAKSDEFWSLLHLAEITAAFGKYVKIYGKATKNIETAKELYDQLLQKISYFPRVVQGYESVYNHTPEHQNITGDFQTRWSYSRSLDGHKEGVHCLAVSPDGRLAVVGGGDEHLRIWEIATGKCKKVLKAHPEGTSQVCINHNGHFAASIGRENVVRVWDLIAGECVSLLEGHVREITCLGLTITGYLVTGSLDKTIRIWDLGALDCKKILKGHNDKINCIAVTPDGRFAISGSEDKMVGFWDIEEGRCLKLAEGHQEGVTCLTISSDSKFAVSGSWDQKLRIWDIEKMSCVSVLEGHTGTLNCLTITADNQRVISGSQDKTIRIWDIQTGECSHILEGHTVDVTCLCVAAKSRFVVSGSWDQSIRLWSLDDGRCLAVLEGHTDLVNSLVMTPDEMFILSGGDDTILRVWRDLSSYPCPPFEDEPLSYLLQRPPSHHGNMEEQRCVEKLFSQAESELQSGNIKNTLSLYREIQGIESFHHNTKVLRAINSTAIQNNLSRNSLTKVWIKRKLLKHKNTVSCLAISEAVNILISGGMDNRLYLWDLQDDRPLRSLKGHKAPICCISVSPNGRYVVTGSKDNSLRLWELETGRCIYSLEGHSHWVEHVRFTPDGRRLISGSRDNSIRIWEIKTGHRLYSITQHNDLISTLEISSDGNYMISGSHDRTIRVWELESGKCIHVLEQHTDHIKKIISVPESPNFISCSWDGNIHMWNVETGELQKTFTHHNNWINDIYITPDKRNLLSCSLDQDVIVWDIETCEPLQILSEHKDDVTSVVTTPDGRFAVSTSGTSIKIWDLSTGQCCETLNEHSDTITEIKVIEEGRHLISASKDNSIILWELDWNWVIPD